MLKKQKTKVCFNLQELVQESLASFKINEKYEKVRLYLVDDLVSPLSIYGKKEVLHEILTLLLDQAVDLEGTTKVIMSLRQLLKTSKEVLIEFTVEDDGLQKDFEVKETGFAQKRKWVTLRSTIKEFGGTVEVSSFNGIGTTIKFLAKFLWAPPPAVANDATYPRLAGKRILVAEDNEINQKIITHLLKKENMLVDVANDGREAIELFELHDYDCLLLDLQMPHVDGFQTANYLRKKLNSKVPIIAMTASSFANEQIRCFEAGINQYLNKPFTADDLYQRLRYLMLQEHVNFNKKPTTEAFVKDLYSLQALRQANGEKAVVEILRMFLNETTALLRQLEANIQQKNTTDFFKNTAHLKGSLGSLHMQSMMQWVRQLELYMQTEDFSKVPATLKALNKEYLLVASLVEKELQLMQEQKKVI